MVGNSINNNTMLKRHFRNKQIFDCSKLTTIEEFINNYTYVIYNIISYVNYQYL